MWPASMQVCLCILLHASFLMLPVAVGRCRYVRLIVVMRLTWVLVMLLVMLVPVSVISISL